MYILLHQQKKARTRLVHSLCSHILFHMHYSLTLVLINNTKKHSKLSSLHTREYRISHEYFAYARNGRNKTTHHHSKDFSRRPRRRFIIAQSSTCIIIEAHVLANFSDRKYYPNSPGASFLPACSRLVRTEVCGNKTNDKLFYVLCFESIRP